MGNVVKILVTGSNGFVGKRVVELAQNNGWNVFGSCRRPIDKKTSSLDNQIFRDIDANETWSDILVDVECVVHCAARVHQMQESVDDAMTAYRKVNVNGTLNLARQAIAVGVKRFVFLSSIKVNGEFTEDNSAFGPDEGREPNDAYGISKYEAEQKLKILCEASAMELVIIRPPLVYGPGVKANFLFMMRWVDKKVPLPLRRVNNLRSMVFLDNLVDLILLCCQHPNAANKTFLVSDDEDVSVPSLLDMLAKALNKKSRVFSFPIYWLELMLGLVGKANLIKRLCFNLQVDISATKTILNWRPPYTMREGIDITVKDFLRKNKQ